MFSRTTSRSLFRSPRFSRSFTTNTPISIPKRTVVRISRDLVTSRRPIHTSFPLSKGLQPDTEDPTPPTPEPDIAGGGSHVAKPADISIDQYHELSDQFIDDLMAELEEMAEDPEKGLEVEYSAGVLNLQTPAGTYILNKQPPNKQIWLSSPISGPKRYDWVYTGDSQHQKEGTVAGPVGSWIYLRDGSALPGLLKKEVGVDIDGDELGEGIQ